jgi:hypothetical protein
MIKSQFIVEAPTPASLDMVPGNIIFFPSPVCGKSQVAEKSPARLSMNSGANKNPDPAVCRQSAADVRKLFADTCEILKRGIGETIYSGRFIR